jgi:tripartite-type tricarboxylate transporter receptor subunit TctC
MGTASSGPNTATELENTKRAGVAPPCTRERSASNKARVLSVFKPHIFFDDQLSHLKSEGGTIPMVHVPFKGSPESKTQIMSGLIPVTSDSLPPILPQIKANQMKALAVIDVERSPYLKDVPTLAELGYPGVASVAFFGLVAPKGTPVEAINILNKNIREILQLPAVQEKFKEQALTLPKPRNAAEFNKYLASEVAKWKKIVVDSNVKVE